MINHRSHAHNLSSSELKPEKNSDLNGIQTRDLCNTGAVLYQLSYQAIYDLSYIHFYSSSTYAINCFGFPMKGRVC